MTRPKVTQLGKDRARVPPRSMAMLAVPHCPCRQQKHDCSRGVPEASLLRGTAGQDCEAPSTLPTCCLTDPHQALFEHSLCAQPWARPDLKRQMRTSVSGLPPDTKRPINQQKIRSLTSVSHLGKQNLTRMTGLSCAGCLGQSRSDTSQHLPRQFPGC